MDVLRHVRRVVPDAGQHGARDRALEQQPAEVQPRHVLGDGASARGSVVAGSIGEANARQLDRVQRVTESSAISGAQKTAGIAPPITIGTGGPSPVTSTCARPLIEGTSTNRDCAGTW